MGSDDTGAWFERRLCEPSFVIPEIADFRRQQGTAREREGAFGNAVITADVRYSLVIKHYRQIANGPDRRRDTGEYPPAGAVGPCQRKSDTTPASKRRRDPGDRRGRSVASLSPRRLGAPRLQRRCQLGYVPGPRRQGLAVGRRLDREALAGRDAERTDEVVVAGFVRLVVDRGLPVRGRGDSAEGCYGCSSGDTRVGTADEYGRPGGRGGAGPVCHSSLV